MFGRTVPIKPSVLHRYAESVGTNWSLSACFSILPKILRRAFFCNEPEEAFQLGLFNAARRLGNRKPVARPFISLLEVSDFALYQQRKYRNDEGRLCCVFDVGVIAESFLPDFSFDAGLFERLPLRASMKLFLLIDVPFGDHPTTRVSAGDEQNLDCALVSDPPANCAALLVTV